MVEIPKKVENKGVNETNNEIITSTPQVKAEDVEVEREASAGTSVETPAPRKPKDDPIAEIRAKQESAEAALATERARAVTAERERDAAKAQIETTKTVLAKSEAEKVAAQELAVANRLSSAKAEVENAERALEEAIDTGKPAKEQISLNKKLSEAVYNLKGAENAKAHFDNWKEREKNKPAVVAKPVDDGLTEKSRKWVSDHPKYTTDKHYRRAAIAAHEDAVDDGVAVDSDEYFRRINEAVAPLEKGNDVVTHQKKNVSATSTGAPVSHDSTEVGARGGNAAEESRTGKRKFKLDGDMQRMAIQTYGKNSSFKLSDQEAYQRYAAKMLEIRDRRANGEHI